MTHYIEGTVVFPQYKNQREEFWTVEDGLWDPYFI